MKLKKLHIKNFKGITDFTIRTNGGNRTGIFGDNGLGKTTVADAVYWLMFNKDSNWKSKFQVKPLDADGNEIHNLVTSVEAEFQLADGSMLTLEKSFKEKYTRKRGSVTDEFTGHTTTYAVNGVPTQKKDFEPKVKAFANEDLFKLLTSPTYFNVELHWKKRREILLDVCGDITDADVIASTPELSTLPAILEGKSTDDYRLVVTSSRKNINEELVAIPAKIEGANEVLPERINTRVDVITGKIVALQDQAEAKRQDKAKIEAGGMVAELEKQVASIDTEIANLRSSHTETVSVMTQDKRDELGSVDDAVWKTNNQITTLNQSLSEVTKGIDNLNTENKKLREQYNWEASVKFDESQSTCPTCRQSLPAEEVESLRKKFNAAKATTLEKINNTGRANAKKIEQLEESKAKLTENITKLQESLADFNSKSELLRSEIDGLKTEAPKFEDLDEYNNLAKRKADLQGEIQQLQTGHQESIDNINQEIEGINEQIKEQQALIDQIEARQKGEKAIADYEDRQKELAAQYEEYEKHLALLDLFTKTKVSMLEESINSNFSIARFKLFEEQVNGGLAECCETVVDGVPYNSLNHASKIKAGLDIADTLATHYGFRPMIFVDGAESVTELPEMQSQVIALYVSEADKELRVEETA